MARVRPRRLLLAMAITAIFLADGPAPATAQTGDDANGWASCTNKTAGPLCPGPLSTARYRHTANLLDGGACKGSSPPAYCGKVLVVGGGSDFCVSACGEPLDSAELYNPSTGRWQEAAPLTHARSIHSSVSLPDGRVLIVGGFGEGALETVPEIYDPKTNRWIAGARLKAEGSYYQTASILPGGMVLIAGGTTSGRGHPGLDSSYLYDPVADRWTKTRRMIHGRGSHTATVLEDGSTLITGGFAEGPGPLNLAERFDPETKKWKRMARMSTKRFAHSATLLGNGEVLVAGGVNRQVRVETGTEVEYLRSAEIYNPDKNAWRRLPPMNAGRGGHSATLLDNRSVLMSGGGRPFDIASRPLPLASTELFDSRSQTWSTVPPMLFARALHTATVLDGPACRTNKTAPYCGKLLVAGGGDGDAIALSPMDATELILENPVHKQLFSLSTILLVGLVFVAVSWLVIKRRGSSKSSHDTETAD